MVKLVKRFFPVLDIGLAALAGVIWYVRPQIGWLPVGLLILAALLRWLVYGSLTRATRFDLPIFLFLGTAFLAAGIAYNQGIEWSQHLSPLEWAWGKFFYVIGAVGLYYAAANLRTLDQVWGLIRFYALFGTLFAIYFVLTNDWSARGSKFDLLTQFGMWFSAFRPDVPGHRVHPNLAGGLLAFVLPFSVPMLAEARARRQVGMVALWSIAALGMLFGWIMSSSRGAWLALVVVGSGWYVAHLIADRTPARRVIRWALPLLLIGASAALLLVSSDELSGTVWQIADTGVVVNRGQVLTDSLSLARDYFFTGGGLGAFPMLFSTYCLLIPVYFIGHSHNLFLDILIEQGIIGLLSYLWLLGAFFWTTATALRHSDARRSLPAESAARLRWVLEAATASMLVMVVHGIVDDNPYATRALLLIFIPCGMIAALKSRLPRLNLRPLVSIAPLAIAVVALGLIWQRDAVIGAWYANLGAVAQARAELAQYKFPERLPENVRKNCQLSSANCPLGEAERYFQQALAFDSGNVTANQRLAAIALAQGEYEAARSFLQVAYARDTANGATLKLLEQARAPKGSSQ